MIGRIDARQGAHFLLCIVRQNTTQPKPLVLCSNLSRSGPTKSIEWVSIYCKESTQSFSEASKLGPSVLDHPNRLGKLGESFSTKPLTDHQRRG